MGNCKCGYTKYWDQEYQRTEYKLVGGERFQGRIKHASNKNAGWSAKASNGAVNPSTGTGGNASTNLEPSDWQPKDDWKEKGGPINEKKIPLSFCAGCKPIGKPEKIASGDPTKPGNDTPGDPKSVTVTFTGDNRGGAPAIPGNPYNPPNPYAPGDSDSKNCKTKERKNTRIDKYKQKYSCES
jgi:hypothetical protein